MAEVSSIMDKVNLSGYRFTVKSTEPWIVHIHNFLSEAEINHLLQLSQGRFKRSVVVGSNDPNVVHDKRTSESCMFAKSETEILRAIEQRVANITGMEKVYMEPYQLVRYAQTQQYASHFDWFNLNEPVAHDEVAKRGQRVITILAYLQEPSSGGETYFPRLSLHIPPVKGSAIMWFNMDRNGKEDEKTEHGGAPVYGGTKIAMNIWLRTKPYV